MFPCKRVLRADFRAFLIRRVAGLCVLNLVLGPRVLLFTFVLAFLSFMAGAQTKNTASRVTQALDEKNLVSLPGNIHPLARPEFDKGLVADAQPLRRVLLVLQRRPEQETALQKLQLFDRIAPL